MLRARENEDEPASARHKDTAGRRKKKCLMHFFFVRVACLRGRIGAFMLSLRLATNAARKDSRSVRPDAVLPTRASLRLRVCIGEASVGVMFLDPRNRERLCRESKRGGSRFEGSFAPFFAPARTKEVKQSQKLVKR
jgi:hypothetical protein